MKIAIVGKGGVGKTTLAAALARRLQGKGRSVIAVDADPDGNLASALGVPPERAPEPIAGMRDLIRERTDAGEEGWGKMFKLNPDVGDLPERFSVDAPATAGRAASGGRVKLLVMGTVETGGKGCMCPEGAVLKALMQHLLLRVEDDVILDMEAGLEHMGRASASGVDAMVAVVEPGMRSVRTAERVRALAKDIGVADVFTVVNKVRDERQLGPVKRALGDDTILGVLPHSDEVALADLEGRSANVGGTEFAGAVERVGEALDKEIHHGG